MIGVINPNSTQTLDAQMLAAARADFQVAPGEPIPKEGSGASAVTGHHLIKLSTGDIIGIVVGSVALLIFCMWLLWRIVRHRSRESSKTQDATHTSIFRFSKRHRRTPSHLEPEQPIDTPA